MLTGIKCADLTPATIGYSNKVIVADDGPNNLPSGNSPQIAAPADVNLRHRMVINIAGSTATDATRKIEFDVFVASCPIMTSWESAAAAALTPFAISS